jgi:hypothetical protein
MNAPASNSRLWQWLGGMGVAFTVLFIVANVLLDGTPSIKASPIKIISYYSAHKASITAGVFVVAFAALAFAFFLIALRRALSSLDSGSDYLSVAILIGGAVYLGGLLLTGVLSISLIDAAHYHLQGVAQTLNLLDNDDWLPVVVGLSIVALATGMAAIRSQALPRWLSWASVVLGVLAVSGPIGGIAFLLAPVWTLAVGIVLIRRSSPDADPRRWHAAPRAMETVSGVGSESQRIKGS